MATDVHVYVCFVPQHTHKDTLDGRQTEPEFGTQDFPPGPAQDSIRPWRQLNSREQQGRTEMNTIHPESKGRVVSTTTTRRVIKAKTVVRQVRTAKYAGSGDPTSGSASTQKHAWQDMFQSTWMRLFTIELPMLSFLFGLLVVLQTSLYMHDRFLHPYLRSLQWTDDRIQNERTYPSFDCASDPSSVSLRSPDALFLNFTNERIEAKSEFATHFVMQHGGAVFPDLIRENDATVLREYLLHRPLSDKERLPVLMNTHRRSIALTALEHPIIPKVLRTIASNTLLRDTLTQLLGPDPAIMAFSTIMAFPGASHQNYHVDKPPEGSSMQFTRSFLPNYALLIPLQDTTASMGATAMCPGTHRCHDMNRTYAEEQGFPVVNSSSGIWKSGYGLLYHSQVRHRGSAHEGKGDEPDRVVLILTFGSRPVQPNETSTSASKRMLPLLPYFAIRWDMWGFTWNDMLHAETYMKYPWLRALGLWKHPDTVWGWTAVDNSCALFAGREYGRLGVTFATRLREDWWWWLTNLLFPLQDVDSWSETDQDGALYEWFLVEYVRRLRVVVGALLVAAYWGYFRLLRVVLKCSVRGPVIRLSCIAALTVVVAILGLSRLHSSEYWNNLAAMHVNNVPDVTLPLPLENETVIETPSFQDVLLSPSLLGQSSSSLYAYARLLDYHEGNRHWREIVARHSANALATQEDTLQEIVEETTSGGTSRRFLTQVRGGWVEMSEMQALEATRDLMRDALP